MSATTTPQLDSIMKPEVSAATKAADTQLAQIQTLLLDSLAPLISLVEAHNTGKTLAQKEVMQVVRTAVELVGNANSNMSHLRRERVVCDLNKALLLIVGDDANFKEVAPLLFGTEFAKKGKEMVNQVKAIRSTISKKQSFERLQQEIQKGWTPKRSVQGAAISGRERPVPGKQEIKESEPAVHVCLPTQ